MGGGGVGKHNSLLWQIITPLKGAPRRKRERGGLVRRGKDFTHLSFFLKKKKERTTDRSRDERKDLWLVRTDSNCGWRQLTVEKKHE